MLKDICLPCGFQIYTSPQNVEQHYTVKPYNVELEQNLMSLLNERKIIEKNSTCKNRKNTNKTRKAVIKQY